MVTRTIAALAVLCAFAYNATSYEPTVAAAAATQSADEAIYWIDYYAVQYGLNPDWLQYLAWCESRYVHVGDRYHFGIFQYAWSGGIWDSTWYGQQGIGPDQVSLGEYIRVTAELLSAGNDQHWPNCSRWASERYAKYL